MEYRIMTDEEWLELAEQMVDEWAAQFEIDSAYEAMIEHQWTLSQDLWDAEG